MKGLIGFMHTAGVLVLLAGSAAAQQPPVSPEAAGGRAAFVIVLQPQRAGETAFDVTKFGGTLRYRSGSQLAVTLPEAAVEGLRQNPQVRYIQRMVIGRPPAVTATGTAEQTLSAALAASPPPPPSSFRVAANATSPWTTGNYTYDGSGNISTIGPSTDLVTNAYRYDRVGRLSSATIYDGTQQHSESYVHDSTGNLTQLTKGDVTLSYPVDQATNRLVATLATYDAVGNLTEAAGGAPYTYDQLGMIVSDDYHGYVYTADDERLAVGRPAGNSWTWRWTLRDLGGRLVREFSSFGPGEDFVWIEDHFHADGMLVASQREAAEGGVRHFHLDHLGTPRLVTDDAGNLVSEHVYAPYGREITSIRQERRRGFSREQPLRFTGHERDGIIDEYYAEHTDYVDYMHARFYNPNWGRFLSVDPTWESADLRRPQSWNRYSYVINNPVNMVDPDGKAATLVTAGIGALTGAGFQIGINLISGDDWDKDVVKEMAIGAGLGLTGVGLAKVADKGYDAYKAAKVLQLANKAAAGLKGSTAAELMPQAMKALTTTSANGATKAAMFEKMAAQVTKLTNGAWSAARMAGPNGSHVFFGKAGEALVINAQGQVFRGQLGKAVKVTKDVVEIAWDQMRLVK